MRFIHIHFTVYYSELVLLVQVKNVLFIGIIVHF